MNTEFAAVSAILQDAIAGRAFPAAAIEIGRRDGPRWSRGFGRLTYEDDALEVTPGTVFDLASLTKVIATATLAMRAVDDGLLALDDRLADRVKSWRGADRELVTIRDLLSHASGLTAYLPFFRDHTGRPEFEQAICSLPLEYAPRTQSIYSDLGFILLGFVFEDARQSVGARWDPANSFASQFHRLAAFITPEPLVFNPPRAWRPVTAPTELDRWRGRLLTGEVHDENAWALGGAAGHAGLFGTAPAVGAFARAMLRTLGGEAILAAPDTAHAFIRRRDDVPGSSRALGWDTMRPTSSCGTLMSATAIGHTGFTGTSLWIDWERDLYVVLLTNRVHPTRDNTAIQRIRPAVHDAIITEIS